MDESDNFLMSIINSSFQYLYCQRSAGKTGQAVEYMATNMFIINFLLIFHCISVVFLCNAKILIPFFLFLVNKEDGGKTNQSIKSVRLLPRNGNLLRINDTNLCFTR